MNDNQCDYCHGSLIEKRLTVDFRWRRRLVVIENVPVLVCSNCGERYYEAAVVKEMERIARARTGTRRTLAVPVRSFAKVAA